jgi:hypothetical protein
VTAGPGDWMPAGRVGRGRLRVSHLDREFVVEVLKAAFVQGRLSKDEFDLRVGQALAARTLTVLAALIADLPAGLVTARQRPMPARARPRPPASRVATSGAAAVAALGLLGRQWRPGRRHRAIEDLRPRTPRGHVGIGELDIAVGDGVGGTRGLGGGRALGADRENPVGQALDLDTAAQGWQRHGGRDARQGGGQYGVAAGERHLRPDIPGRRRPQQNGRAAGEHRRAEQGEDDARQLIVAGGLGALLGALIGAIAALAFRRSNRRSRI